MQLLTLIREFLGLSNGAISTKIQKLACDVTAGTKKIKLCKHIGCQLGHLMMAISNGICQCEGKYAVLN